MQTMEIVSPPKLLETNFSRDSTLVNVFASTTTVTASVDSQDEIKTETARSYNHPSTETVPRKSKSKAMVFTAVNGDSDSQLLRGNNNGFAESKQSRLPLPPNNTSVSSKQKTSFSSMLRRSMFYLIVEKRKDARMKSLANILLPAATNTHQTSRSSHRHESTFKRKFTLWEFNTSDKVNGFKVEITHKEREIEDNDGYEERQIKTEFAHEEHEAHAFSQYFVKDVETDKLKYEADGAKGSENDIAGDIIGEMPIVEGTLERVGTFVKDAAEAFVQPEESEAKDPATVANSKAVMAAITAEKVLENVAKDVDPLSKGITQIAKGDVVGGTEVLTQESAQIGADVVVPVVDAVGDPSSAIASEVDKLAPELVKGVGAATDSIGNIVEKKTAAGVGPLVDTPQQTDVDRSSPNTVAIASATTARHATPPIAIAHDTTSVPATSASPSAEIAQSVSINSTIATDAPKSDQNILDIAHSIVDAVNNVKAHYDANSATTLEIERLAVLMLKQLLSAN
ncbi:hypothetical protein HK100_000296 [Physocladia obscura]|uniref:Uncharacterized protein n=1 Tax=Physocladia obscura TaxID=109957 RepID=A0AAD5T4M0_9FUNG|nr:hypothetical protein HK100_000296 [Physocladia obscura]